MDEDSMKKCKCCLEEDGLLNLWEEYKSYGESIIYGDMIKECFALPLQKPITNGQEYICESCVSRLTDAINFKKEILSSDMLLKALNKEITESQFKQETESDVEIKTEYLDIEYLLDDDCKDMCDAVFSDDEENVEMETMKDSSKKRCTYTQKDLDSCTKGIQDSAENFNVESGTKKSRRIFSSVYINDMQKSIKSEPGQDQKRARRKLTNRILTDPIGDFANEQIFLNHLNTYSNATPLKGYNGRAYECYFCDNQYEEPAELKAHTRKAHRKSKLLSLEVLTAGAKIDVTDLTCLICHTELNLITDFSEHLKKEHSKTFDEATVDYLVPLKFSGDKLQCAICAETFLYFKLLYEHMKKHIRNFECESCGCGFITRRTLRAHIRRHDNGEYKCNHCSKVFFTKARVRNHQKQVHFKVKRNKCSYCDEKFNDLMKKKKHECDVHGAKKQTFVCQACERQFQSQKSLACHIKEYHLMIRNHKCTVCEQTFVTPLALREHMVKHTRARDFICKVCNKGFSRRYTLVEHMRIHMNDRRHKCELCGSAFIQKSSLRNHIATKHPHVEV
ncbi:zinc finger protein 62-like [Zerene cesonia]|uniref:zinc finger protein 62-like n=1 Tax=Zerene cesonia TaxID=33412 RepID=UPI0018E4F2FC|nr:zinc finger protein 62-like [Zerene cesonia]